MEKMTRIRQVLTCFENENKKYWIDALLALKLINLTEAGYLITNS